MAKALDKLETIRQHNQGANPAGFDCDELPAADEMQRIAAEVGFCETAFIAPRAGRRRTVRFARSSRADRVHTVPFYDSTFAQRWNPKLISAGDAGRNSQLKPGASS